MVYPLISVGIKNNGRFLALIRAGHTPATLKRNPKTGAANYYMTESDISAFHSRFVTLSTLAKGAGEHHNSLRIKLKAAGLGRYSPKGEDFGMVFLKSDVARWMTMPPMGVH